MKYTTLISSEKGRNELKTCLLGLSLALASLLSAQDTDPKFQQWMKTTAAEMGSLRKNEAKTGPEAAASAEKLSAIYAEMGAFWTARNATDAAKLSEEGKSGADALAAAAKAGDADKAGAAFKQIGGTCKGCHEAHREKSAEGAYKIK